MIRLTRLYRFCASHRLHTERLNAAENQEVYGKCNNPHGHGHNYQLEVTVGGPLDRESGRIVDLPSLDGLVQAHVLDAFDHRDLNSEVPEFTSLVPTSENLALVIEQRLQKEWGSRFPGGWPRLENVRLHETPRNRFDLKL